MTMNTRTMSAVIAMALLTISGSAAGADATLKICVNCHGEDGVGTDTDTPIIAGIKDIVQEDALYAYADGDRDCGSNALMCKAASRLTEEQVVELAAHFAAMPFVPAGEEFDAALAEKGKAIHDAKCAFCHGDEDPGEGDSGILHGQRKGYLRYALEQYAASNRKQLPMMEENVVALSADDIEALVNYYASAR